MKNNSLPYFSKDNLPAFYELKGKCWEWKFCRVKGYGILKRGGKTKTATRLVYKMFHSEWDESGLICHSCDNPRCINPEHLFVGSHKENSQDMVDKGRHQRGEDHCFALFTNDQVKQIIEDYKILGRIHFVANKWNVKSGVIREIIRNETYQDVYRRSLSIKHLSTKFDKQQLDEIVKLVDTGLSFRKVAKHFNTSHDVIADQYRSIMGKDAKVKETVELSPAQIDEIFNLVESGISYRKVGEQFGTDHTRISRICKGIRSATIEKEIV